MKDDKDIEVLILDKELEERYNKERSKIKDNVQKELKGKKRKKLVFYYLLLLISLGLFLFSGYKVVMWMIENYKTEQITTKARKIGNVTNDLYVNFKKLKKENPDTVAWIKVNGTNIDYPVVQRADNQYYLYHSFDNSFNYAGWIFSDYRNDLNSLNKNSVIYGHGRLDGSMFGSLKNVFDESWLKEKNNNVIFLVTEEAKYTWEIFSTYSIKSESYYIITDFNNKEEYQEWLNTVKKRSSYDFKKKVTTKDKVLTLSTCKNDHGDRIAVHAKLINKIKN
ncbi:MAG: class B sortase [Bacilli bacterium]|nr:class B sortase [Bacilli bacterium]